MIAPSILMAIVLFGGQSRPAEYASSRPTSQPAGPRIVDFGEGIKINYIEHQVEVAGQVILREGPLELFAYSKAPAPKEHESIVLVRSKPERVFMALGLIGATPGKPLRWFPDTETLRPATGDPIDVLIRYGEGKSERTIPAVQWMLDAAARKPMSPTHWLFCGSERSDSGEFAANMEGTLITVVDFSTSLLALPQQHSDADSDLWLMANERAIPPVGTPVTLILRPMSTLIKLRIAASGEIEMNDQRMSQKALLAAVQRRTAGWLDRATFVLERTGNETSVPREVMQLQRALEDLGVERSRISIQDEKGGITPRPRLTPNTSSE